MSDQPSIDRAFEVAAATLKSQDMRIVGAVSRERLDNETRRDAREIVSALIESGVLVPRTLADELAEALMSAEVYDDSTWRLGGSAGRAAADALARYRKAKEKAS